MKKITLVSFSALVGAVLAVAITGLPLFVHAAPPPVRETRTPGDTNCDGKLDMSDAIFTLNYLFQGTAFPPCPLADPPALVARIAELEAELAKKSANLESSTAQLAAKDAMLGTCQSDLAKKAADLEVSSAQLAAKDAMLGTCQVDLARKSADLEDTSAQLASIQADLVEEKARLGTCQADLSNCTASLSDFRHRGLPATGQAKCNDAFGNEIPCDSATCPGQDGFHQTGCPSEGRFVDNLDGTVSDNCTGLIWQKDTAPGTYTWCDALLYCENLSFGGGVAAWDDWRLPNVRELQSIVDYGRVIPTIDPVFGALTSFYWSSTSLAVFPSQAWGVNFIYGTVGGDVKGIGYPVRAVHNAP